MRRRKNILEFKRPRTIKDIEALWFVDYTEKDNDPYAPSWWIYLKKGFRLKTDETIFIPLGAIHRIENPFKKPVRIIEAQVGSILRETDIIRYEDVYGRIR